MLRQIQKLKKLGYERNEAESIILCDRTEKFFQKENNFLKTNWEELKNTTKEILDVVYVEEDDTNGAFA